MYFRHRWPGPKLDILPYPSLPKAQNPKQGKLEPTRRLKNWGFPITIQGIAQFSHNIMKCFLTFLALNFSWAIFITMFWERKIFMRNCTMLYCCLIDECTMKIFSLVHKWENFHCTRVYQTTITLSFEYLICFSKKFHEND